MMNVTGDSNCSETNNTTASLQECQSKMNISLNKVQFALSSHASSNVYVAIMESAEVLLTLSTYLNSAGSAVKAAAISQQLARMLKTAALQLKSKKKHKTSSRRNSLGSSATDHRYGGGNSESTLSNDQITHSHNHSRSSSSTIHYNHSESDSNDNNQHHNDNNEDNKTRKFNGPPIALQEPHVNVVQKSANSFNLHDNVFAPNETEEWTTLQNELNELRDDVSRLHDERQSWEATHEELLEYIEELETKLDLHNDKNELENNNNKNKKQQEDDDDLYSALHELQDALEKEQLKSKSLNESLREAEQLIAHDDAEIGQLREELKKQRDLISSREKEMHNEKQEQLTTTQVEHEQEIAALKATLRDHEVRENDLLSQIRKLEQLQKASQTKENKLDVKENNNVNEKHNKNVVDSVEGAHNELNALRDANAKLLSQLHELEQHNIQLEQEMEDIRDEMEATRETAVVYAKKVKMCTLEVQDVHKELERVERSYAESQHHKRQQEEQESQHHNALEQENSTQTLESQTAENDPNSKWSTYTATIKDLQHELNELTAKVEAERVSSAAEVEAWRNEAQEQTARANACEAAMRHQANELQERLLHLTHTLEEERARNEAEMIRLQQRVKEHETKYTSSSESHIAEQRESQNTIRTLRTQNKVLEMKIAATEEEITRLSSALEEAQANMESITHTNNKPLTHAMSVETEPITYSSDKKTDNMNTTIGSTEEDEQMQRSSAQTKAEREKLHMEVNRLAKINDEYLLLSAKYNALISDKNDLESKLQLTSEQHKDSVNKNKELNKKIEELNKQIAVATVALDAEKVDHDKKQSAYIAEINDLRSIIQTNKAVIDNLERGSKELNEIVQEKDKLIAQLTQSMNMYTHNELHLPHAKTKYCFDDISEMFKSDVHELNDLRNTINANLVLLLEKLKNNNNNTNTTDATFINGASTSAELNAHNNIYIKNNNGSNVINGNRNDTVSFTSRRKFQNCFAEEMQLYKLKEHIDAILMSFNDITNRARQEIEHIQHTAEYLRFVLRRVNNSITTESSANDSFDNAAFNTYICLLQRIEQLAALSLQYKTNDEISCFAASIKSKDNKQTSNDKNSDIDLSFLAQRTPRKRTWRDTAREYSTSPLPSPLGQRQSNNSNNNNNDVMISPRSNWRL